MTNHGIRVPTPVHLRRLHQLPDLLLLLARQLHVQRPQVLLQVLDLLGAGDRDDVVALRQQPRQRQLARRDLLLLRQRRDAVHQLQVLGEVLLGEARRDEAEVALLEVGP